MYRLILNTHTHTHVDIIYQYSRYIMTDNNCLLVPIPYYYLNYRSVGRYPIIADRLLYHSNANYALTQMSSLDQHSTTRRTMFYNCLICYSVSHRVQLTFQHHDTDIRNTPQNGQGYDIIGRCMPQQTN